MRDDICTIPVSEAFEENDGCAVCRMYRTVENRIIEYIMGAAMMEPDVREETNRLGFCGNHLFKMTERRGRLQLALMLETHTADLHKDIFAGKLFAVNTRRISTAQVRRKHCFICEKINWGFERMIDTIYRTYERDGDFRKLFSQQDFFCFEHYTMLAAGASKKNMKRYGEEFISTLNEKTGNYLAELSADLKKYSSMYDYRNSGADADWGNSKDAIERTVKFLGGCK